MSNYTNLKLSHEEMDQHITAEMLKRFCGEEIYNKISGDKALLELSKEVFRDGFILGCWNSCHTGQTPEACQNGPNCL